MPIQGQSEIIRLDRLGKIRLGERVPDPKHEGQTIPRARDYFVVPPEVQEVYGKEPKELTITFPTDDEARFLREEYRCYGRSYMLSCHGDGVRAMQKTDLQTGAMVDRDTQGEWEWRELTCDPDVCPMYQSKQCRPMMSLQFMLPDVPGLGVWELTTTSRHSRLNIRGTLHLVRWATGGRVRFIPLKLALGPQEVVPPKGKKKTVYIVHLRQDFKLSDLQQAAIISPERSFLPPGSTLELPAPDIDNAPEDLVGPFSEECTDEAKQGATTPEGVQVDSKSPTGTGLAVQPTPPAEKPASKKAETKGAKPETKAPPAETKPAAKETKTPSKKSEPAKIDVEKMAKEILGDDGVTSFVMPEMVRLFGEKARLADLNAEQLGALADSIQKEKLARKAVTAFPKGDEAQRLTLRRQLNASLMAKFGDKVDRCLEWLQNEFNTKTSETLSLAELKVALERSKDDKSGTVTEFPLF